RCLIIAAGGCGREPHAAVDRSFDYKLQILGIPLVGGVEIHAHRDRLWESEDAAGGRSFCRREYAVNERQDGTACCSILPAAGACAVGGATESPGRREQTGISA